MQADEIPQSEGQPGGPGVPPVTGPVVGPQDRETNKDARMWAMICHLAGLCFILPIIPGIGAIVGPLVVWLIKKQEFPFVEEQGKEAINFQITMFIYGVVSAILLLACIGMVLLPAVILIDVILAILAAVRVNDGYHYRYPKPFIIRLIK